VAWAKAEMHLVAMAAVQQMPVKAARLQTVEQVYRLLELAAPLFQLGSVS
jgi:hypothetical protein